jgi:signal transduction histidine kinase/DNA-binding response OmpR family regulator
MDPLRLAVELLFGLVFLFVGHAYLRRRDAISRDLTLAFAGLGLTFLVDVWRRLAGSTPPPVGIAVGVLLLLQPLFVLHLVSRIRDVPRAVLVGATALLLGSVAGAIVLRSVTVLPLVALVAFVGIEALAAVLLLLEARRRRGPGAIRLALAAASTALFAVALVSAGVGAVVEDLAPNTTVAATVLALLAAVGYLIAFAPPAAVVRAMQASATVGYVRRVIEMAGEPAEVIWAELARLAVAVRGGRALIIVPSSDGTAAVAATSDASPHAPGASVSHRLSAPALDRLRKAAEAREDVPIDDELETLVAGGDGRTTRGTHISVLKLRGEPVGPLLVLVSRHGSLFAESDRELLVALGAQTAIVVERRMIVAEQEELAARLSSTVEALHAASEAKSDFLASMSHELRTPLSAILGFSDLMRSEPSVDGNVSVPLEWIEHMHRGGEHLVSLINDLLDLAKVEAGRLELRIESLDVGALAAEVVNGVRPIAERKQVRLAIVAPSTPLQADRGRVRQILYNLLSNAIKYTPEQGSVDVRIGATPTTVEIEVGDTGVGIADADLETVFEEFRQVGDHDARQQGTGLGLALTRRLVEAHGGTIRVESVVGRGSRFTASLPTVSQGAIPIAIAAPPVVPERVPSVAAARAGILVIEDDPSAVRLLREYLEPSGYVVHVAADGEEGLVMARRLQPAAIILDVLLPGVDGWDVLRRAKADEAISSIPVIIVTVVDEQEVGLALGAVDYIVKPVRRSELLRSLMRHVRPTAGNRPKVLAVDDDPAALEIVRAALEPEGFEVHTTTSAVTALEMLQGRRFDLVVSDVVMPDLDGFELARRIHENAQTADMPVLLVTAHDLSAADKKRLNGKIIGIASKGGEAQHGLLRWLEPYLPGLRKAAS